MAPSSPPAARPWQVVVVAVAIVAVALGLGFAFGEFNPAPVPSPFSHPSQCGTPIVNLTGAIDPLSTPLLNASFAGFSAQYLHVSGGCIAIGPGPSRTSDALHSLATGASDFLVTSTALPPSEIATLPRPVLQFPIAIGSLEVVYHDGGLSGGLNLTPGDLVGIYLGSLTHWGDPALLSHNPGLAPRNTTTISPVHDANPSGATAVLTDYLSQTNRTWGSLLGAGPSVNWTYSTGAPGPSALLQYVANVAGAIGYVESNTPLPLGVAVARIANAAGQFVAPSAASVAAAASAAGNESAAFAQSWANVTVPGSPGATNYPLAEFGFGVVYADLGRAYQGAISLYQAWWLLSFFYWITHTNATTVPYPGLADLPPNLVNLDSQLLVEVTYNGTSVLFGAGDGETGETGGSSTGP